MSFRVPFDQWETALLINACCQIDNGALSQREAIRETSKLLRKRAVEQGIAIDDVYRNESGISRQLYNVQRLMHHKPDAKIHNSKIFIETVALYYNDRAAFDRILLEAKGETTAMKTNQELFAEWLSQNVFPSRLSDLYLALNQIEKYVQKHGFIADSIYDLDDAETIGRMISKLKSDRIFCLFHKSQMRDIMQVLQLYNKYTQEHRRETVEKRGETMEKSINNDFIPPPPPPDTYLLSAA